MKTVKLFEEFLNEETQFPAQFEIGEPVSFKTSEEDEERWGSVVKVSFTKAKVFYDILDDYTSTVVEFIDSAFIKPLKSDIKLEEPTNEATDNTVTLNVSISNLDQSTADDFLKMFAFMEWCGAVGSGRSFKAYFDGDGHFRPKIKVEGIDLKDVDLTGDYDDEKNDTLDLGFGA